MSMQTLLLFAFGLWCFHSEHILIATLAGCVFTL